MDDPTRDDDDERDSPLPAPAADPAESPDADDESEEGPVPSSPEPLVTLPGAPANDAAAATVSVDVVRTYLAARATHEMLRKRAYRRVFKRDLRQDLMQDTLTRAAASKTRPRNEAALAGWLVTIFDRTVADHFAKLARRAPYEGEVDNIDELAEEPPESDSFTSRLIVPWITREVAGSPVDEETLDILSDKARNEKTWETVAQERQTTPPALWNRVGRFKKKYLPGRRRYLRLLKTTGIVLLLAALALAAYLISQLLAAPAAPANLIGPDRARAPSLPIVPAPVPSDRAAPSVFEPATGPTGRTPNGPEKTDPQKK